MRKVLAILVIVNLILLSLNVIKAFVGEREYPLTDEGVPGLTVLPDGPGQGYSASRSDGLSSCFTIGPYYSEKVAHLLAGNVRAFGIEVTIRSMSTRETLNYLVFIPNIESRKQAEGIISDLWKNNVDNGRVVEKGDYKNTVTLGFFKNLEKARRQTEYVRYLGYDARYSGQKVVKRVYWVDYDEPLGTGTPVLTWSRSIAPDTEVQVIPRTCDQKAWYGKDAFSVNHP